ncbi:MAG: TrbG/VirB9 family P-type conjugative transfer protein [Burkholderiales bacterium]|nr:TrbG/VirB9 family P-type conjugative transfer protein [Burkholderiales bacterium]
MPTADLAALDGQDPRLQEVDYDPKAVVTVPVHRGTVSLIVLGEDEHITEVASGLGGDCTKADAPWCIAAQPGGRHLFVKAKKAATAPNNVAVVTDKRSHALRFVVLADGDPRLGIHRLVVKAPQPPVAVRRVTVAANASAARAGGADPGSADAAELAPPLPALPSAHDLVAERLQAAPTVLNSAYSLAEGRDSADIVPSLVFDDGRFTYLRFAGNAELPAVFHVQGDGSETLVNTRMEGELMVVDRVSRRLVLRAGQAVVGLWNEAFDLEGRPQGSGATVPGVQRVLRGASPGGIDEPANPATRTPARARSTP